MIREEFQAGQWQFPFVVYHPEIMSENLPLIIQLHGAGERGNGHDELCKVDIHGFSKMLQQGDDYPCIFVMPQCSPESFWAAEVPNIYGFIQAVIKYFHADEKRIYLTGLSMGGFGTWYTSMRYPQIFAAIAPVCGGGLSWRAGALKGQKIRVFHSVDDTVVPFSYSEQMVSAAKANGADVMFFPTDRHGHNCWDYAYEQTDLIEWLVSNSK